MRVRMRRLRWTTFVLVVLAYALSFFHRMAPATIAADLQQAFATSGAVLGAISATYFYVYTVMQIPTGVLADTLGPRRILTLGGIIAGVGSLMFGLAESVTMLASGRLLVGLGVSVTFIAMLKLHAAWFHDRHFGTFTGLSILLGNLGAVAAAAPLAWVLVTSSWRTVFEVIGVLSLALGVLSWYLVRNTPSEAGLPSMRELDGHEAHPVHHGHWYDGLIRIMRNRATWPAFWVNFGLSGSMFAFAGLWAVPYLTATHGFSRAEATLYTSLLLAGFALGALSIGTLSDSLGRRRPVVLGFALVHLTSWQPLLFGMQLSPGWLLLLFFLMGLGAACFTLSWACVKEVNPHALSGMATSVANTGA
ncbi:MAG TPA: MFS transporter, partial [Gammaproteobacteria bacterium]|nr:MFS transporter [Gammaproteobacteria bacterium]